MGHTKCGAVTAACNNVELGNITALLSKIKPAVKKYSTGAEMDEETIERVAVQNVLFSIEAMKSDSPILAEMVESNEILIVGAIYNVSNGQVKFID